MRKICVPLALFAALVLAWTPSVLFSQGRQEALRVLRDCIASHGFAETAIIKPSEDENVIEVDIRNVWDITITGVMIVPLGPLAEEHFSGSWFVFEFDPLFLRPNEVRTHSHSFQGLTHAFPEEIEIEIAVVNVRNIRPRWVLADFDSPWPFISEAERFQIAERIFCDEGKF